MPDIRVPDLEGEDPAPAAAAPAPGAAVEAPASTGPAPAVVRHRSTSLFRIALEVLLIALGVFLGLMGEQWRQRAEHRELAQESLGRFRAEIQSNRAAVAAVKDYHATLKATLDAFFAANTKDRERMRVKMDGLRPVAFDRTAWDLAIVTQSLAYMDPELAADLSRVYTKQQSCVELNHGMLQAMYVRPPASDLNGFLAAASVYYDDMVVWEPGLIHLYDDVLPKIDRALGQSGSK